MSQGARVRVILVVRECIWNGFMAVFDLPTFDATGSSGYPPCRVAYRSSDSTLITASRILGGNIEAELKPNLSLRFYFSVFLFFFSPNPLPLSI